VSDDVALAEITRCFEGAIPAVVATASADGTPNITYLSRVHMVDHERVALSNQFFSKTARNLAENPRGSILLIDPTTYDQFRLAVVYERTERRGPVFDRLREDVDALATLQGMQDVFRLRAADIYRVGHIERVVTSATIAPDAPGAPATDARDPAAAMDAVATLAARLGRSTDLDVLVAAAVDGLAELFGYTQSLLLLLDETGRRLYTIASHGFGAQGVGSELAVGEGIAGLAAARSAPVRVGNLRQMTKYSRSVWQAFEEQGDIAPGREIPFPEIPEVQSAVAVPLLALGQLVGVLAVESDRPVAFTALDESILTAVAAVVANAIESDRARERLDADAPPSAPAPAPAPPAGAPSTLVRFFPIDGSTFLDGDYLIKGVAGRILWALVGHHAREGRTEFTNREVRLDPSLELPEFRDNFESRLILLKRRLDERAAPIRIEKTGRGRFRLLVETALALDEVASAG
jgi:predicted pyridoxine 5'-phosphate oxidase superfamily flavin-nucleotide-binding protein